MAAESCLEVGLLSKAPDRWGGSRAGPHTLQQSLPCLLVLHLSPSLPSGTHSSQCSCPHFRWLPRARPDLRFLTVPQITNLSLVSYHSSHPQNSLSLRKAKLGTRVRKRTSRCIDSQHGCPFLSKTATESFPRISPMPTGITSAWDPWNARADYHPIRAASPGQELTLKMQRRGWKEPHIAEPMAHNMPQASGGSRVLSSRCRNR